MDQEGKKGTEEERRLAYVGITRAKRHCVISFASNRRIYNQWQNSIPSRFVDELPSKNVEILNPPGLYSKDKPTTFNSNNIDENRNSGRYNSPGWGRLKFNNIENYKPTKTTNSQIINSSEIVSFAIKERVFHQKFGYGVVVEIEGEKILVNFEKAGEKNVMASYLFSENNLPF